MKLEDLQVNGYYVLLKDMNKDIANDYIFKNIEVLNNNQPYIKLDECYYSKNGHIGGSHNKNKEFRLATASEIAHLDACIAANKYVEPSEVVSNQIINDYLIY